MTQNKNISDVHDDNGNAQNNTWLYIKLLGFGWAITIFLLMFFKGMSWSFAALMIGCVVAILSMPFWLSKIMEVSP
jgi:hypothetical protein